MWTDSLLIFPHMLNWAKPALYFAYVVLVYNQTSKDDQINLRCFANDHQYSYTEKGVYTSFTEKFE